MVVCVSTIVNKLNTNREKYVKTPFIHSYVSFDEQNYLYGMGKRNAKGINYDK